MKQQMENSNEKNMIYCKNCGSTMPKVAEFCESCGAPRNVKQIKYVKTRGTGDGFGKAVAIIFGSLFIVIAVPLLFGGGALMGITGVLDQGGGYIGIDGIGFQTSTQVIITKEMDFYIDDLDGPPRWMWGPEISDLVTIKIKADSNTGDDVFIGIIHESDAYSIFSNVAYDQITEFRLEDTRGRYPYIEYRYHSGEQLSITPKDIDVWVTQASGSGEQTLIWSPDIGTYWLVIMNQDGSANVDVDGGVSVRMPILDNIGKGLFVGGLILLGMGVALVYFGAIKPR
jgi:ribosomal protein L37E